MRDLRFTNANCRLPIFKSKIVWALGLLIALTFCGCEGLPEAGAEIAKVTGVISADEAKSITRGAKAVQKTWQDLTPEQEYYIGRAVAAQVFQTYPPLDRPPGNTYLNLLGQSLAIYSERPETFGGYHFLLLDSDEINAFAAPGGLILVTRGMVRCCANEDELDMPRRAETRAQRDQAGPSDRGLHHHRRRVRQADGQRGAGIVDARVRGVRQRRGDDPHDERLLAQPGT